MKYVRLRSLWCMTGVIMRRVVRGGLMEMCTSYHHVACTQVLEATTQWFVKIQIDVDVYRWHQLTSSSQVQVLSLTMQAKVICHSVVDDVTRQSAQATLKCTLASF